MKNFVDGGYGEKAGQAEANGEYAKAAGYVGLGTTYAVMNALTLGEAGAATTALKGLFGKLTGTAAAEALAASGPGAFIAVSEAMSIRAAAYQARVTGAEAGTAYAVNGVKFDGYANGVLLEAKSNYAQFVKDGQFRSWFSGADSLVSQAQRQLNAANGMRVEWRVAEDAAANAMRSLFQQRGITGVNVIHVP